MQGLDAGDDPPLQPHERRTGTAGLQDHQLTVGNDVARQVSAHQPRDLREVRR
jgi:hypothetical protein